MFWHKSIPLAANAILSFAAIEINYVNTKEESNGITTLVGIGKTVDHGTQSVGN